MNPAEARRRALLKVGGLGAAREAWRDRRGLPFLETLVRDVVHALRVLGRNKGWSAVAIVSLALGVGATAAVFRAANALLLRKLPVPDPDSLVTLRWEGQNKAMTNFSDYGFVPGGVVPSLFEEITADNFWDRFRAGVTAPYATFQRVSEANTTLTHLFALGQGPTVNLIVDGKGETASSQFVSGAFYAAVAIPPAAGRQILPADDRKGAAPVAVISHAYWQQRFGKDPAIVGKRVRANAAAFTIVGVSGSRQPPMVSGGSSPSCRILDPPCQRASVPARKVEARSGNELVARDDGPAQARRHRPQVQANLAPPFDQATRHGVTSLLATFSAADLADARTFGLGDKIPRLRVVSGARGAYQSSADAASAARGSRRSGWRRAAGRLCQSEQPVDGAHGQPRGKSPCGGRSGPRRCA